MTLCVAAQCDAGVAEKVVIANDFSMESGIASAEIEYRKMQWIGQERYPVLMSGEQTRGLELIVCLEQYLDSRSSREQDVDFLSCCRLAVRKHKHTLANEYVSARLGIAYDDLLGTAHSSIPENQYVELLADIERMKLGCELLVIFFTSAQDSLLVRIDENGRVEVCSNFAAVGSGMYIAESSLFQREHSRAQTLSNTIYHVYEAMRLGARAPGVGIQFVMSVAAFSERHQLVSFSLVTPKYMKLLAKEFDKFGPRPLKNQVLHQRLLTRHFVISDDPRDDGTKPLSEKRSDRAHQNKPTIKRSVSRKSKQKQ
jgi:hypothetical protein